MPRRFPKYPKRPHKSGHARITLHGKDVYLGPHGSPESWTRYQRLLAEWTATGGAPAVPAGSLTVEDVVCRFLASAKLERRNSDGSQPWGELVQYRTAARPLLSLCGDLPAREFGPRQLRLVQQAMVTGQWSDSLERRKSSWCRRVANRHTVRIQTLWRWAESEGLLPPGSYAALATVGGLRPHQHGARESRPVQPVPQANVDAALPYLNPVARDMVRLLLLTGARPGELCRWTPADVVRGGKVQVSRGSYADLSGCWCVWLSRHKTDSEGAGPGRFVLLCPESQAILSRYLDRPPDTPLFSCAEGRRLQLAEMRARRKTRVQPSQLDRRTPRPRRCPGVGYSPDALAHAIRSACAQAGVPRWTPYQLRHAAITRWGRLGDAEAARILAGHSDLGTTRTYLVDDLERAARLLVG